MKFRVSYTKNGKIEPVFVVENEKEFLALKLVKLENIDLFINEESVVTIHPLNDNNDFISPNSLDITLAALEKNGLIDKQEYQDYLNTYTQHTEHPTLSDDLYFYKDLNKTVLSIHDPEVLKKLENDLILEKNSLLTMADIWSKFVFFVESAKNWSDYFSQTLSLIKRHKIVIQVKLLETSYRKRSDYLNHKELTLTRLIASEIHQSNENSSLESFIEKFHAYLINDTNFRYIMPVLIFALFFNDHLKINHTKPKLFAYDDKLHGRLLMNEQMGSYIREIAFIIHKKLENSEDIDNFIHEVMHFVIDVILKNNSRPYCPNESDAVKEKWITSAKKINDENSENLLSLFNLDGYDEDKFTNEIAARIFEFKHQNPQGKISKLAELNEFFNNFYLEFIELCKIKVLSYCESLGLRIIPNYKDIYNLLNGVTYTITDNRHVLIECIQSGKSFLTFFMDNLAKNELDDFIQKITKQKDVNVDALCQLFYYDNRPNFLAHLVANLSDDFPIDKLYLHNAIYLYDVPVIHYLCEDCNDPSLLNEIIKKFPALLTIMNDDGDLPIHFVLRNQDINLIKFVLTKSAENGIDLNIQGNAGNTVLIMAIKQNSPELVNFLLSLQGIDSHQTNNKGRNALHVACYNGYYEVAKKLLEKNACALDSADDNGNTPLHLACKNSHLEIAKLLLMSSKDLANKTNRNNLLPEDLCSNKEFEKKYLELKDYKSSLYEDLYEQNSSVTFFSANDNSAHDNNMGSALTQNPNPSDSRMDKS